MSYCKLCEATKAELEEWKQSFQRVLSERDAERAAHEAAEARVAELERACDEFDERYAEGVNKYRTRAVTAEAALDQARGLLETAPTRYTEKQDWWAKRDEWLCAHPANATPAATGAEPRRLERAACPHCTSPDGNCPWHRAEKEQGT